MTRPAIGTGRSLAPRVAFRELRSLWLQITETLCKLACTHCLNASGPRAPWLAPACAFLPPEAWRELFEARGLRVVQTRWIGSVLERLVHHPLLLVLERA